MLIRSFRGLSCYSPASEHCFCFEHYLHDSCPRTVFIDWVEKWRVQPSGMARLIGDLPAVPARVKGRWSIERSCQVERCAASSSSPTPPPCWATSAPCRSWWSDRLKQKKLMFYSVWTNLAQYFSLRFFKRCLFFCHCTFFSVFALFLLRTFSLCIVFSLSTFFVLYLQSDIFRIFFWAFSTSAINVSEMFMYIC